jgi:RNA polymerase sigma-70 factor (ECF subfamily)
VPNDTPPDAGTLFRAHVDRVTSWARKLGGPTLDPEDVVQEVFLIAHRQLAEFRGDAKLTTWLYRITENVVRHRRRKERFRRWLGGSSSDVADDVPSETRGPAEEMESRQATALVYRALDRMSEKSRTVIILYEFERLSGAEIAEMMGTSPDTVRVWLHRARAQLVERIKKERGSEE